MIGTRLGPLEIVEGISADAMATVYRAYQPSMDCHVAVKVIDTSLVRDDEAVARFQREARLEHLYVLPVYDSDGDHTPPYIVMRYLEDGTIRDVLTGGPLHLIEIAFLIQRVGQAGHSLEGDCQIPVELSPAGRGPPDTRWSSDLWRAVGQAICGEP